MQRAACVALALFGCASQAAQSPASSPTKGRAIFHEPSPPPHAEHDANRAVAPVLQRAHRALDLNERLTAEFQAPASGPKRLHQRLLELIEQCRADCDAPILARGWTFVAVVRREALNDPDGAVEALTRARKLDPIRGLRIREGNHPLSPRVRPIVADDERCTSLVAQTVRSAMETSYADGDFKQAERELRTALDVLERQSCLKHVRAKVWRLLGIVLALERNDAAAAKAAFGKAVLLEPRAELEKAYASPQSLTWYLQARGQPSEPDVTAPAPSIVEALERVGDCESCSSQLRARARLLVAVYAADVLEDPFAAHDAYCSAWNHNRTVKPGRALSVAAEKAFHSQRCDLP